MVNLVGICFSEFRPLHTLQDGCYIELLHDTDGQLSMFPLNSSYCFLPNTLYIALTCLFNETMESSCCNDERIF